MANPYIFKCIIKRIVDGDTIDVDEIKLGFGMVYRGDFDRGLRIRLSGIDTPECRTKDSAEKKYGLAAKAFVESMMPVGTQVIIHTKDKDKYGRWLADFKVGNRWLTKELLKHHHAIEYVGQSKSELKAAHRHNRTLVVSS